MEGETGNQSKQERFRTRWTPSLDRIFADLVVQQIQLGNRPNNVFDKKTWNHIRDEFNKETGSKFNNNQLRKHLDVLRTRFNNVKSAFARNEFALVDPCGVGFDLWEDSFGVCFFPAVTLFFFLIILFCILISSTYRHNLGLRQLKSRTVPYMSNSARFSQIHQLMGSMPNQVTLRVWTNLLEMILQVEFHGQMAEPLVPKIHHHHQNYQKEILHHQKRQ
jgi:hypothetical protein